MTVEWTTHFQSNAPGVQATPDEDYVVASGVVTFLPDVTEQSVPVSIKGETDEEADELLLVSFRNPTNAALDGYYGLGAAIIEDDDTPPTLSPGQGSVSERHSGTTTLEVPVTLSQVLPAPVTVEWQTVVVGGLPVPQAEPAADYAEANGILTFEPGDTEEFVQLTVYGDVFTEPDETVIVGFDNPVNAALASTGGSGVIENDDATSITVTPWRYLHGGDIVTVEGSGYLPDSTIAACQALDIEASGTDACLSGTEAVVATAGVDGTFTFTQRLYRNGHVDALGTEPGVDTHIDCAHADNTCLMATAALDNESMLIEGTQAVAETSFDSTEVWEHLEQIEVSPAADLVDGQELTVTGTGPRLNSTIDIYQCVSETTPYYPWQCDWSPRWSTTSDAAGDFTATITAQEILFEDVDCKVSQCHIAAVAAIDFRNTIVSTPIDFADVP